jgi:hypothetical protein
MTNEEVVHFWPTNGTTPCGAPRRSRSTYVWSEVTCGECRLEQPMDRTGNPERKLAPAASAHILAERLAEVQEIEDRALGEIRHWTTKHPERSPERLGGSGGTRGGIGAFDAAEGR